MNIQWYPGHMAKAIRQIEEDIKLVDMVIELRDARAPHATANPELDRLIKTKKRLLLLNKADLADEAVTAEWLSFFRASDLSSAALDSRKVSVKKTILSSADRLTRDKREKDRQKGILSLRPVKAMVVGIPNVGKSTLINSVRARRSLKTGDKPGVTRGNQWINIDDRILLLDTPGVLYPKISDEDTALMLAFIGSVSDDVLDRYELSIKLLEFLYKSYPDALCGRYGLTEDGAFDAAETLGYIAKCRGALRSGGGIDLDKAAGLVIDDFRKGRIGRVSLERPENHD